MNLNMKTRKSLIVSCIKIVLVILIIIAILYGSIKVLTKEYSDEEFETVKTNMLLIQAKTEIVAQKVEIEAEDAKYVGTEIEQKENDEKIQNLIRNNIIDIESKDNKYYCIDNTNLEELGLSDIKIDDYFIVDYKQNEVIFIDGIQNENGDIVYKLSEMN